MLEKLIKTVDTTVTNLINSLARHRQRPSLQSGRVCHQLQREEFVHLESSTVRIPRSSPRRPRVETSL